jgi:hypothetical protein
MRWALTGAVLILVSCGGGASSSNGESSPAPTDTSPAPIWEAAYKVGDTGPGGGIVVYVEQYGLSASVNEPHCPIQVCHYLEMAPTDLEGLYDWDEAILAVDAFSTPSANDWVLPSMDSLNIMCMYAYGEITTGICNDNGDGDLSLRFGGFSQTDSYWSSTEYAGSMAWYQFFGNGYQNTHSKGGSIPFLVRPVRMF